MQNPAVATPIIWTIRAGILTAIMLICSVAGIQQSGRSDVLAGALGALQVRSMRPLKLCLLECAASRTKALKFYKGIHQGQSAENDAAPANA